MEGRVFLDRPLVAGEAASLAVDVQAPNAPGSCLLEFDLVWDGVASFKERGNPTHMATLEVL